MIKTLWPALLFALVCGAAHASHQVFKDWEVACDNTRRCEAAGYEAEDAPAPVVVSLLREAGAAAPVKLRLMPYANDEVVAGPLTVQVGTAILRGLPAGTELPPEQVARLLPLLRDADAARIADGKREWILSLAGIKAALLRIDDVQGRLGTPTALVRPGTRPVDTVRAPVPVVPVVPVVRLLPVAAPRQDDRRLLPLILATLKNDGCEDPIDFDGGERDNEIHRLSASQVLLILQCTRGIYQSGFAVWIANDKPPYAPQPARLRDALGREQPLVLEAAFYNNELTSIGKRRGLGDCNVKASWGWTAAGFQLVEAYSSELCRAIPDGYLLRDYTATMIRPASR